MPVKNKDLFFNHEAAKRFYYKLLEERKTNKEFSYWLFEDATEETIKIIFNYED